MAKNQRQRRPLQDDTRSEKQTVRERTQVSKRQRDRIEENRDRREQRRERQRLRRQTVDSVRSPKEDVRTDRFDSRLVPIEDTFLGRPVGVPTDLPVVIGERWNLTGGQSLAPSTPETVVFDSAVFTTERNGYPVIFTSDGKWRIPAGLGGIWNISTALSWPGAGGETFIVKVSVLLNGSTTIASSQTTISFDNIFNHYLSATYNFQEADYFEVVGEERTAATNLNLQAETFAFVNFLGK